MLRSFVCVGRDDELTAVEFQLQDDSASVVTATPGVHWSISPAEPDSFQMYSLLIILVYCHSYSLASIAIVKMMKPTKLISIVSWVAAGSLYCCSELSFASCC